MSESELKAMVEAMTGEADDTVLSTYLSIAENKICRKAYPFDPSVSTVPEQYQTLQAEIAAYLLNKRGAEGEKAHNENGISRTYEDGDVPPTLMRQITPFAAGFAVLESEATEP